MNDAPHNKILIGDALAHLKGLPDRCVQTCITSPPYWGLRDYGTATWKGGSQDCDHRQGRPGAGRADGKVDERFQRNRDGAGTMGGDCRKCGARRRDDQIGLEKTSDEFCAKMVEVFREVRRVLRDDGTLWLNLGDSYNGSGGIGGQGKSHTNQGQVDRPDNRAGWSGLKPKDLIGIPWRVAFSLQADGWYLRSDIIWSKTNPMPESVTDRPTKAHEYVFLMSKSAKYFYDAEAIKERGAGRERFGNWKSGHPCPDRNDNERQDMTPVETRNRRTVWEITTHSYPEAHFATFPEALVQPCILAGTSEKGCCSKCGSPLQRQLEKSKTGFQDYNGKWSTADEQSSGRRILGRIHAARAAGGNHNNPFPPAKTIGWKGGCKCDANTVPCIILDPFIGSGTTALVALKAGRKFIGIELNPKYAALAEKRIEQERIQLRLM